MFSNSSFQNKSEELSIHLAISDVIGYHIIPGVNILSVITNIIFCSIILKLKKRSRFYNILLAKQIQDLFSALLGIGW